MHPVYTLNGPIGVKQSGVQRRVDGDGGQPYQGCAKPHPNPVPPP